MLPRCCMIRHVGRRCMAAHTCIYSSHMAVWLILGLVYGVSVAVPSHSPSKWSASFACVFSAAVQMLQILLQSTLGMTLGCACVQPSGRCELTLNCTVYLCCWLCVLLLGFPNIFPHNVFFFVQGFSWWI